MRISDWSSDVCSSDLIMKTGELVPDDVILGLVDEVLDRPECAGGAVFDGFPRTVEQARALEQLLSARGESLDQVLIIEVPAAEIRSEESRVGKEGVSRCRSRWSP